MVTTARRWNSYVCPGCRFVFRVPQDHDGTGVVCPACRIMLRLPGPEDDPPPLVAHSGQADGGTVELEEYDDSPESDEAAAAIRSDRNFIATLALSAVALLVGFGWWMMPDEKKPAATGPVELPATSDAPSSGEHGLVTPPKPRILEMEAVAKAFLESPTRDEALRWVRDPEATAKKWAAWNGSQPYAPPGFKGLAGEPLTRGEIGDGFTTIQVRTGDYLLRELAFVRQDGQLKVDWDSWAGWSEMSWADFQQQKPSEPKLFRVTLSQIDYYNFSFKDEREWSSYRLDSPDGAHSIYGYVPRTSESDQRIRPHEVSSKTKWLLKLKFPVDAAAGNQVLIDSVVAEGWVERP